MLISDWSSDVCSSDLDAAAPVGAVEHDADAAVPGERTGKRRQACLRVAEVVQHPAAVDIVEGAERQAFELKQRAGDEADIGQPARGGATSDEHPSELQSLMRISYAVFFLNNKQEN